MKNALQKYYPTLVSSQALELVHTNLGDVAFYVYIAAMIVLAVYLRRSGRTASAPA